MLKMKIKAFFKYKGYREQVLKKDLSKGIKNIIFLTFLISTMICGTTFGEKIVLGNPQLNQINTGDIFKLRQFFEKNKTQPLAKDGQVKEVPKENTNPEVIADEEVKKGEPKIDEKAQLLEKVKKLEAENQILKEDNINLQNSIRIAASRGTKPRNYRIAPPVISRSGALRGQKLGQFTVTAYTPTVEECGSNRGITCSGYPIVPGVTVAVDPKYWPIGTVFYIKGLGYVIAMDSGGAIKGKNRFDFAVLDKEYAKRIGVRKFEVYLISMGNGKVGELQF